MERHGNVRANKRLGQVFLINEHVAVAEAVHGTDKVVLEVGPGTGMLTKVLCVEAKRVIAVEKDRRLYALLKHEVHADNLTLINSDFMEATDAELELSKVDIVIANVPYYLSSAMIEWLADHQMQAVLCLQKEFIEHMLAKPDTGSYSKLSVACSLLFRITKIMNVSKGNFRPVPKVDSAIIYMKPLGREITDRQMEYIGLLMQHKKKTVRNAVLDSHSKMDCGKEKLSRIAAGVSNSDKRVFKLNPEQILSIAKEMEHMMSE